MPKVIGIAGQVGAGKSIVLQTLNVLYGLPLFDCDNVAKQCYFIPSVRENIINSFGVDPIEESGKLAKDKISALLANNKTKKKLEKIIHNAVREQFELWKSRYSGQWIAVESAILFTSDMNRLCDITLAVEAETPIRKRRVLRRDTDRSEDGFELLEALQKIESERQKNEADLHINNSGKSSIIRELEVIYNQLDKVIQDKQ